MKVAWPCGNKKMCQGRKEISLHYGWGWTGAPFQQYLLGKKMLKGAFCASCSREIRQQQQFTGSKSNQLSRSEKLTHGEDSAWQ